MLHMVIKVVTIDITIQTQVGRFSPFMRHFMQASSYYWHSLVSMCKTFVYCWVLGVLLHSFAFSWETVCFLAPCNAWPPSIFTFAHWTFGMLASVQLCTLCSHTSVQFCTTGETLLIRLDFLFLINMRIYTLCGTQSMFFREVRRQRSLHHSEVDWARF